MNPYVLSCFVVSLLFVPADLMGLYINPPVDVSPRVGTTCGGDSQELPGASAMAMVWGQPLQSYDASGCEIM